MACKALPHQITRNDANGLIFVEFWAQGARGPAGTGYLRTFDACDWNRAACYIDELKSGRLSGKF